MKSRTALLIAVFCAAIAVTSVLSTSSEGAEVSEEKFLLDYGNGKTVWFKISGDTVGEAIDQALESAGIDFTDSPSLSIDGKTSFTIGSTVSKWQFYRYDTTWVSSDYSPSATYSGEYIALGFYPVGYCPTVTPEWKNAWTCLHGDALNSCNTNNYDPVWGGSTATSVYYDSNVPGCYASPLVANGKYYQMSRDYQNPLPTQSLHLVCMDIETGSMNWNIIKPAGGYELATGVIYGGYVYHVQIANVYALPLDSTDVEADLKTLPLKVGSVKTQSTVMTGISSIVYDSGHLFLGSSGGIIRCLTPNLDIVWETQLPGGLYPSMTPTVSDGLIYIGACNGTLYILDEATGNLLASELLYYDSNVGGRVNTPAIVGDSIMVSYGDGAGMSASFWAYAIMHYDSDANDIIVDHNLTELPVQSNTAVISPISQCVYTSANNTLYRIFPTGSCEALFKHEEIHGGFTFVNNTYLIGTAYEKKSGVVAYNMSGELVGKVPKSIVENPVNYTMASTAIVNGYIISGNDSGSIILSGLPASGTDAPDPEHSVLPSYTITWKQDDGTTLGTTPVKQGTIPTFDAPTKTPAVDVVYTFAGWTPEVVAATADATYTATYSTSARTYTVAWFTGNSAPLISTVAYGSIPEYPGATAPTKASTAQYNYIFAGWNPEITEVTGNTSYTAKFTAVLREYTITWYDGDTLLETDIVAYGEVPEYTGVTPTKDPAGDIEYKFDGWDPYISRVTANAKYTAVFTDKTYLTVTWENYNGEILEIDRQLVSGVTPTYDGDTPMHESSTDATYTFTGWAPVVGPITESTVYVAQFESSDREYVITWYSNNVLLKTDYLHYMEIPEYTGITPSKESTAEYTYTFSTWSPEITAVTDDIRYDAVFTRTPNVYTVTYKVNGNTTQTEDRAYGETVTLIDVVVTEGYRSTEWTSSQVTFTENSFTMPATDVIITREEIKTYTITWKWGVDGSVTETVTVDENTLPSHDDVPNITTPTYYYSFVCWIPEITDATEDATYTAKYDLQPTIYLLYYFTNGVADDENGIEVGYGTTVTVKDIVKEEGYIYSGWSGSNVEISGDGKFLMPAGEVRLYRTVTKVSTDESGRTVHETVYNFHTSITVTVTETYETDNTGQVSIVAKSSKYDMVSSTMEFAIGSDNADIVVNVPLSNDNPSCLALNSNALIEATFMANDMQAALPSNVTSSNKFVNASTTHNDVEFIIDSASIAAMADASTDFRVTTADCSVVISSSIIEKYKSGVFSLSMLKVGPSYMTEDQRKAVSRDAVVMNIKALSGTTNIGGSLGGRMLVTMNYSFTGSEPAVYYLPETGSAERIEIESYTDTSVTFYVDHLSYYAVDKNYGASSDTLLAMAIVAALAMIILAVFLLVCYRKAKAGNMSLAVYLGTLFIGKAGGSKIRRNKRRLFIVCLLGFTLTILMFFLNIAVGPSANLPFFDAISALMSAIGKGGHDLTIREIIVYETRLPRALAAVAVGIGLSIAGCVYQAIIRNPLVDPYIMGVSSGAGTFAVAAISANFTFFGLLAANSFSTPILAALGGLTAFGLTLLMAEKAGGSSTNYVLAGVIVGLVFSAIQTLLLVTSSSEHLTSAISWLFGSFANVGWSTVWMIFFPAMFLSLVPMFWAKELNLVLLGEDQAKQMGLNVIRFNRWMLILASVLTSVCVAFVGIIGFVGMVIPHLSRMMLGGDHRLVLPASVMMGGALMLFADFLAKMLMIPTELPVGAITTIIGVPVFAYLLIKKGRMYDG